MSLFDHLIGAGELRWRNAEVHCFAGLTEKGNRWDMVLLPHRGLPVTSNRDTIRTAIGVASNAAHRRDPMQKTDEA